MSNLIVFLAAIGVGLLVISIYLYNDAKKYEDSPFSKFNQRIFNAFFNTDTNDRDAMRKQAVKFGIKPSDFEKNNLIIGKEPDYVSVIMQRIYSIVILFIAAVLFLVGELIGVSMLEIVLCVVALALVLFIYPTSSLKSKANQKKEEIERDLVYFSDLFLTALKIDMPIQTALLKTAQNYPCALSEELLEIDSQMVNTSKSWQDQIMELSFKYSSKPLNEFASHIITGEETGTDIIRVVREICEFLKTNKLTQQQNKAKKLNEMILVPIGLLKLLPLVGLIILPAIGNINQLL